MVRFIKSVHTAVFVLMSACILYTLYCGFSGRYDWFLVAALGIVFSEGIILIISGWKCPLTELAKKYGDETGRVTDMFFPQWFVPHVFRSCSVLFVAGLVILAVGYFIF